MAKSTILGIAILWAAAIIASAIVLRGAPQAEAVIGILSCCAFASTVLLGGGCRRERGHP